MRAPGTVRMVVRQLAIALMASAATAHAGIVAPQCAIEPSFHKSGTATFGGRMYHIDDVLKTRLIEYHKSNPNCVMTNFVTDPGTDLIVVGKAITLLAKTGLLPAKFGLLIEPRNHEIDDAGAK